MALFALLHVARAVLLFVLLGDTLCMPLPSPVYTDVELHIVETQTGNQIRTENQMTLICNASNFDVAIDMIKFFGPNLELACLDPPSTCNFPDGTVTCTDQTCSLKIPRPSLKHGGVYYCQVQPLHEMCFDYTSSQVEVLLTINSNNHAFEGTRVALIFVSCALVLLMVVLAVLICISCKRKKSTNQGTTLIHTDSSLSKIH